MAEKHQTYPVERAALLLPFLLERVKGKSRNNVKSLLTRGQVLVDGIAVTRHDCPLAPGQSVTVEGPSGVYSHLPFPVIFEDEHLLVIDKPAGLLSVATDEEKEATAYHQVTDYMREKQPAGRVFIVHRLDRDTSGVLLFAKDEATKRAYQDSWDSLVVRRGYVAVTEGVPQEREGTVRSWLQETKGHMVYSGNGRDGKEAITHYRVRGGNRRYALVELGIDTGRKNQIRVHMKDLGCPVAGDKKYGARTNPLGRLALHASELVLRHPETGVETRYFAPIPAGFRTFLRPERNPKKI